MNSLSRETRSLATIEACNALKAEEFRALPEEYALWRFREVLTKLGPHLGLSGGAVVYALDLMGMLREADWRGDGRPVTYHSLRAYARKVGKSERTIARYERQLIEAGLAHRTLKHARRHGGQGDDRRRTGLDWRAFGATLPDLLDLLDQRAAYEARRLDLEARIKTERRIILGLAEALDEDAALNITAELTRIGALRLGAALTLHDLQSRLCAIAVFRTTLIDTLPATPAAQAVDNTPPDPEAANQSDISDRLIDITDNNPCPADIRIDTRTPAQHDPQAGLDDAKAKRTSHDPMITDAIPLEQLWQAAPDSWKAALGSEVAISWPALIELADHLAPRLGVSAYAWTGALRALGPMHAALALMILDRNRDHPRRPVASIGGALVGMVRRAEEGALNLTPSLYGIMQRKQIPRTTACKEW